MTEFPKYEANIIKSFTATLITFLLMTGSTFAQEMAARPEKAAATSVAVEYLSKFAIIVRDTTIDGNRSTENASVLDMNCVLELLRSEKLGSADWQVEKANCDRSEN